MKTSDPLDSTDRPAAAATPAPGPPRRTIRTAVVVVHGMGSQLPVETLDGFVKTALTPLPGEQWRYHSRPAAITRSYEARRYIAFELNGDPPPQRHTDIFEYHWSYLMTGNRLGDVWATTLRVMLRRPSGVPSPLFGPWRLIWLLLAVIGAAAVAVVAMFWIWGIQWPAWAAALLSSGIVVGAVGLALRFVGEAITSSFVDVVRYLDNSPRSYEARRAIRGGLVDLLRNLHDDNYDRIVVVAHSLGGYISYDALSSLWAELHTQRARPSANKRELTTLPAVQAKAGELLAALRAQQAAAAQRSTGDAKQLADANQTLADINGCAGQADVSAVDDYHSLQFQLWEDLRKQGNPWRITDFVTVGTPMYFADLLITRPALLSGFRGPDGRFDSRALFGGMLRRGQLVRCPPRSETLVVDDAREPDEPSYGRLDGNRQLLRSQSVFAVVRWTNFWFPVTRGRLQGDWFGGPLAPLFGPGIKDHKVVGNLPHRLKRAMAHTLYFSFEKDDSSDSIAHLLRKALELTGVHDDLVRISAQAPPIDPESVSARVDRAG